MATLCEIRQEILEVLKKHDARLVVHVPSDFLESVFTYPEALYIYIYIEVMKDDWVSSTALY